MGIEEAIARIINPKLVKAADHIISYLESGDIDSAINEITIQIEKNPTNPIYRLIRAKINIKYSENEAESYLSALNDLETIDLQNRRTKRIINGLKDSKQIKAEISAFSSYGYIIRGQEDKAVESFFVGKFARAHSFFNILILTARAYCFIL